VQKYSRHTLLPGREPSLRPLLAFHLGIRQLSRAPGTAVYAALTLAIGLGSATSIYSVMKGFNAPLPVPDGARVCQLRLTDPEGGQSAINAADLRAWMNESRSVQSMGAFSTFSAAVNSPGRAARQVSGAEMTPEAFALLRMTPLLGRLPTGAPAEDVALVVSYELWRDWLGGDPDVLGKTVRLRDQLYSVAGVMPEGFHFPFRENFWLVRDAGAGNWGRLEVVARLQDDVERETAREELETILTRSRRAVSGVESTTKVQVYGFTEERGEGGEKTMLFGLLLMVLALVIVSCSNVSNLLLERAAARARSLSVHQALGAVPGQVILQVFTEALLIAALGVVLGLLIAYVVVEFVETTLAQHWGFFWMKVQILPSAFAFTALLGLVTALISGTLPAWRAMRVNIAEPLKHEGKASRGAGRNWASWTLITGQIAFSCTAVIAAVLMGFGLLGSRRVEAGFPAGSMMWASLILDGDRYETAQARRRFRDTLLAELNQCSVIQSAALSTGLPGLRSPVRKVTVEGRPAEKETEMPTVLTSGVTPAFFEVFGIRLLEGRGFHRSEGAGAPAIVSQDFVRHHLGGEPAVGRTISLHGHSEEVRNVRIVGVVTDVVIYASDRSRKLDYIYLPIEQDDARQLNVILRTGTTRPDAASALAQAVQAADSEVPVGRVELISDMLAYVRQFPEALGTLAILGGLGAVIVVTIGLYGIVSFDVHRRLPEFAVRLALGARRGQVLSGVLRLGLFLVFPGLTAGLSLTYLVTPLFGIYLGGTDSHDPRIFGGALAVYGFIIFLAAGFPALRAAYRNPVDILRDE
jgi:putative ABC transport system permease protein